MKKTAIYTNGKSLFTLDNYDKVAGVSFANEISLYKEVNTLTARAMHSKGTLHYVSGMGDRKMLKGVSLKRNQTIGSFSIN